MFTDAEKYIRNALSIYKKNYPKDHPNEISANAELGIIFFYQKNMQKLKNY